MDEAYISTDIEGGGPAPGMGAVREIGACLVGNTENRFYIQFTNGPTKEGMEKFADWLGQFKRPIFVSFNSWDWCHVMWLFHTLLGYNPFGSPGRSLDIKVYYMAMLGTEYGETYKRLVAKRFPPIQKHTHNGLDDAIEQAQIFEQMLAERGKHYGNAC